MKITDNVYFYHGLDGGARRSWSNSVVVKGKTSILIDSGPNVKIHLDDLFAAIAEDGINISEIDEFWYTHSHPDHAGSSGILSEQFQRRFRCHYLAKDILEGSEIWKKFIMYLHKEALHGKKTIKTPSRLWKLGFKLLLAPFSWLFSWIVLKITIIFLEMKWGKWLSISEMEVFDEEEVIGINPDIQILFLPGHTPEEIGFWIEEQKILILGDLISTGNFWREKMPILNNPKSSFNDTLISLKRIIDLPTEVLIPGHGFFLKGKEMIKNFLRRMIVNMEHHRELVKKLTEKNPKIKTGELLEIVLKDMPGIVPYAEKRNYLEAILDDIGYYKQ